MLGIYFSGTGNTKFCVESFLHHYGKGKAFAIEDKGVKDEIERADFIVLGYPTYYSNIPKIMRDFIVENANLFNNKKVFIITTMRLFSGDGAGCAARLLKACGANIQGGLHLKMPDSIGDEKILKRSIETNQTFVRKADLKIRKEVAKLKSSAPSKDGLSIWNRFAGLAVQRVWFRKQAMRYHSKPTIEKSKCIGCAVCEKACPMQNIQMIDQKATSNNKCTLCYRCLSECPTQAITILGSKVYEQCKLEKYL